MFLVLVALLPIHAGLVAFGVPSWWKEVLVWVTLFVALTLPSSARLKRLDWLAGIYFALVLVSAAVHRVTNFADLSPYFVYAPFAIIVPRLLVKPGDVALLVYVAIGSLLFNALWILGTRLGVIDVPNLFSLDGPSWRTTGSLTGGALATATLYGVASGVTWIAAAMSRRPGRHIVLALALTIAGALTGSRASLVASGLGALIAIALTAARLRSRRRAGPVLIFVCVVISVAAILLAPRALRADDSLRASRWQATISLAVHNPVLGAGPGATSQSRVMRELGLPANASLPDNLLGTRVSESSVLKVAAEVGVLALLLISAWVATVLIRAGVLRPLNLYGWPFVYVGPAVVILTIVNGVTYQNMESFVGATLFWLGIGLCRARWIALTGGADHLPEGFRFDRAS